MGTNSRHSKARRKRKQERPHTSNSPVSVTLETAKKLYDAEQYESAADTYLVLLQNNPNDELKRNLFDCYVALEKYVDAKAVNQSIKDRLMRDELVLSYCLCQMGEWEAAEVPLEAAMQQKETGYGLWLRARILIKDKEPYQVSNQAKTDVFKILESALDKSSFPPIVVWWLIQLLPATQNYQERKLSILRRGLEVHSDWAWLQEQMTQALVIDHQYHEAAGVARTYLSFEGVTPVGRWWAAQAFLRAGKYAEAETQADALRSEEEAALAVALLRGEILLADGRTNEAVSAFDECVGSSEHMFQYIGLMARARANLVARHVDKATEDVVAAVRLLLSEDIRDTIYVVYLDEATIYEDADNWILDVCEDLIFRHEIEWKNEETLGLVRFARAVHTSDTDRPSRNEDLKVAWERLRHPVLGSWMIELFDEEGNIQQSLDCYLNYQVWIAGKGITHRYAYTRALNLDTDTLDPTELRDLHQFLYNRFEQIPDLGDRAKVFERVYSDLWSGLLRKGKLHHERAVIAAALLEGGASTPGLLFDMGYSSAEIGKHKEAESAYKRYLEVAGEAAGALNNLALLMEKQGREVEAAVYWKRAQSAAPHEKRYAERVMQLEKKVAEVQRKQKQEEEFLRTAPERWGQLNYYQRQVLCVLSVVDGFDGWAHLARLSGTEEKYLASTWKRLVETGMIIENNNGYTVNVHILPYIQQERSHAIITKLIHADEGIAYKPIFNSQLEYTVYRILVGLFPNHLVFPNMALQAIFQYDRMKPLLDQDAFRFYLMSQVDFCVVSTATYLPLLAFEVDSPHHDDPEQQKRDRKKNLVFQRGGVALLRIRPFGRVAEDKLRQYIIECVREAEPILRQVEATTGRHLNAGMELELSKFSEPTELPPGKQTR